MDGSDVVGRVEPARDVRLTLPYPPSVNALYTNVARLGRVKSRAYVAWKKNAWGHILVQRVRPVKGDVALEIVVTRPDKRRRDLDNLLKATLDMLTDTGVIDDDALVQRISIEWAMGGKVAGRSDAVIHVRVTSEPERQKCREKP